MRRSSSIAFVIVVFAVAACGAAGSGTIDAGTVDSPPGAIDAAIDAPQSTLGTACTGMGQGTCPTGFECVSLQGGSGPWCSKLCADSQDPSCEIGYHGVGFPACVLRVRPWCVVTTTETSVQKGPGTRRLAVGIQRVQVPSR